MSTSPAPRTLAARAFSRASQGSCGGATVPFGPRPTASGSVRRGATAWSTRLSIALSVIARSGSGWVGLSQRKEPVVDFSHLDEGRMVR